MLPWLLVLALLLIILVLWIKMRLLQQAFDEIRDGLDEHIKIDTNTLLSISTRDPHARRLASSLNRQLQQLRSIRRRYQTGDRELMDAVTNISHDLRTPLTAIRGYLDLISRDDLTPEVQRYLTLICGRVDAMTQLTEELFRYSVLQSTGDLTIEPIDLRAAVEEAAAGFYSALTSRGITPQISLPETPVIRQLDRGAISRVLENILNNALKYSAGDLQIVLEDTGELRFSNTAQDLDEVSVGRLFDRFYSVEAAHHSTGLGLAIARALVEQMGGTIGAAYQGNVLTVWVRFAPQAVRS